MNGEVPRWAVRLRDERRNREWSQRDMARHLVEAAGEETRGHLPSRESIVRNIRNWEAGKCRPKDPYRVLYARAFGTGEAELFGESTEADIRSGAVLDDELDALELARRVAISDVGAETLEQLETVVDGLAVAYPGTPPAELLGRVRRHLAYVSQLIDARKTLTEYRRLLVVGGWLSLLAATCHIDLRQFPAGAARLRTAAQLAKHAGHPEIMAWSLETEAWQVLTTGDYRRALSLSQGAQRVAPKGSSAYIQAIAQEGRAWARLGDPAAEPYARGVLSRLESTTDGPPRPRRAVSARLDLALALLAADQVDEAGHTVLTAMTSGLLVPSNYWRVAEVIAAVEARRVPEAVGLREVYQELCMSAELPGNNT